MSLVKLTVRTPKKLSEAVSAALFEAGAGGIEELDGGRRLIVYAATRADAEGIAARARARLREVAPGPSGVAFGVEVDEHSNWDSAWTQHLTQIALTPRLVIQPVWDETAVPAGSERIVFDPKLAFGDGAHATTRLAAVALETACRAEPGARVLDFGSGSGVLAFVALRSGAQFALGIDIDPVSVAAARHNAELNGFGARARFELPSALGHELFDLVVANLEAPTLLALGSEIARRAVGARRLIVTGFLADRQSEVLAALGADFQIAARQSEEDWALLELTRRA